MTFVKNLVWCLAQGKCVWKCSVFLLLPLDQHLCGGSRNMRSFPVSQVSLRHNEDWEPWAHWFLRPHLSSTLLGSGFQLCLTLWLHPQEPWTNPIQICFLLYYLYAAPEGKGRPTTSPVAFVTGTSGLWSPSSLLDLCILEGELYMKRHSSHVT